MSGIIAIMLCLATLRTPLDRSLAKVEFEQKLGALLPLNLAMHDEGGASQRLGNYFGERPVVLVFAYYTCPNLCHVVLNATVECLRNLPGTIGRDFDVVVVSIDPTDTLEAAMKSKRTYTARYARPGSATGWHFLTGDAEAIRTLTDAAGYRYYYDTNSKQFAHASGLLIATPTGKISRYFLGIEYPPKEVRLALAAAGQQQVGSLAERLLLLCFHYNPSSGRFGLLITRALQVGGMGTVLAVGVFILRGRRRPAR